MIRIAIVAVVCMLGVAHADPPSRDSIALLPLDTEARLEIYGRPVVTEIARALADGSDLEVMVIGAKGTIPPRAKLVVRGVLASKGGDSVQVTLYVRNPRESKDLESIEASSSLETIDRGAGELAKRLVPILKKWLATLRETAPPIRDPVDVKRPPVSTLQPLVVGIAAQPANAVVAEPLRAALTALVPAWLKKHRREVRTVDGSTMVARLAAQTVRASGADRGILFDVIELTTRVDRRTRAVFANAKVRLRVADGSGVLFDRVIVTDTIVGKPDVVPEKLLELTAQEILAIARPHLKRTVPSW
jgi:hypothetical protein